MMLANFVRGTLVGMTALGLTAGTVAFAQSQNAAKVPQHKGVTVNVAMTPQEIHPGQRARIAITVVNDGNVTMKGATIFDRLPQGFTFVPHSANGFLIQNLTPTRNSKGALIWNVMPVAPGRQASVWFDVVPNPGVKGTRCTVGFIDPAGFGHPSGSACVSVVPRTPNPNPSPLKCGPGTVEKNGKCVSAVHCGPGTVKKDGRCVPVSPAVHCGVGTHKVGNRCVPNQPTQNQNQNNQNQSQKQSQWQWQTQTNNQTTNVDVDNHNDNHTDIHIDR